MNPIINIWRGLDWARLTGIFLNVVPALICITLHEISHGLVAYWMGDTTAKDAGRLTLNPIKHIDWWGLLMMVIFQFGWAKPVPINMYRFKNPKKGMAVTALAGPVSNLLIACVALALYGFVYAPLYGTAVGGYFLQGIGITAYLSTALAVFNIIPIPPLDGSKVLFACLDNRRYAWLMRYERFGFLILIALVTTGVLTAPLSAATGWVYDKLFSISEFTFSLTGKIAR
jgi:Zn-dependent proteases